MTWVWLTKFNPQRVHSGHGDGDVMLVNISRALTIERQVSMINTAESLNMKTSDRPKEANTWISFGPDDGLRVKETPEVLNQIIYQTALAWERDVATANAIRSRS